MSGHGSIIGSSGADLNLILMNAATLPGTVVNNAICIISGTAVGDLQIINGTPPSKKSDGITNLANGDVYIVSGTSSPAAFNILSNGKLMVYPIAAYQYNGSAWVAVTAYKDVSGSWINFTHTFLYKRGTAYATITEGEASGGVVTQGAASITIVKTGSLSGNAYTDIPLNFVGVTTVYVVYKTNSYTAAPRLCAMQGASGDTSLGSTELTSGVEAIASLDVSAIELSGRVRVGWWGATQVWDMIAYEIYYK